MGPFDLLIHLFQFVAPALAVALALAMSSLFGSANKPSALKWLGFVAINFAVGSVVLVAGLWYFGRDGKMATYAALLVACASSQWWLGRAR
jgi:hypothetical protein